MSAEVIRYSVLESYQNHPIESPINLNVYEKNVSAFSKSTVFFGTDQDNNHIALKLSAYPWGARREWKGLQIAYSHNIPTPEPFDLVKTENGVLGITSRKFDGVNLYTNSAPELKALFGSIINTMHNTVPVEGTEWKNSGKMDFTYFDKEIERWNSARLPELQKKNRSQKLLEKFSKAVHDQKTSF